MDRIIFMSAPVAIREPGFSNVVQELANCISTQSGGELLDLKSLDLDLLDIEPHDYKLGSKTYLRHVETLHKAVTLYLWLSYRFAGVFRSQGLAFHVKSLVEDKINKCLAGVHFDEKKRKQLLKLRQQSLQKEAKWAAKLEGAREEAAGDVINLLADQTAENEVRADGVEEEVLLTDGASEVEGRAEDEDAEIELREDEPDSEEESERFVAEIESEEGEVDEFEVAFDAQTREAEAREKEGSEKQSLFDGQATETEAREEDGSDENETFEDQAVEMDDGEHEVAKPDSSVEVPIPPPQTNDGTKSDAVNT
jgi:hypothetical protein